VNSYLRLVDAQAARAGVEGTDGKTHCGSTNSQGGVMVCRIVISCDKYNDYSKSRS
jgi:hypothetical protein